jgi:hypothetical protein
MIGIDLRNYEFLRYFSFVLFVWRAIVGFPNFKLVKHDECIFLAIREILGDFRSSEFY